MTFELFPYEYEGDRKSDMEGDIKGACDMEYYFNGMLKDQVKYKPKLLQEILFGIREGAVKGLIPAIGVFLAEGLIIDVILDIDVSEDIVYLTYLPIILTWVACVIIGAVIAVKEYKDSMTKYVEAQKKMEDNRENREKREKEIQVEFKDRVREYSEAFEKAAEEEKEHLRNSKAVNETLEWMINALIRGIEQERSFRKSKTDFYFEVHPGQIGYTFNKNADSKLETHSFGVVSLPLIQEVGFARVISEELEAAVKKNYINEPAMKGLQINFSTEYYRIKSHYLVEATDTDPYICVKMNCKWSKNV